MALRAGPGGSDKWPESRDFRWIPAGAESAEKNVPDGKPGGGNEIGTFGRGADVAIVSACALQLHPNCKVIVDQDAARQLQGREYDDWTFQNEPEWAGFRN